MLQSNLTILSELYIFYSEKTAFCDTQINTTQRRNQHFSRTYSQSMRLTISYASQNPNHPKMFHLDAAKNK